jgi:hypothetical protein
MAASMGPPPDGRGRSRQSTALASERWSGWWSASWARRNGSPVSGSHLRLSPRRRSSGASYPLDLGRPRGRAERIEWCLTSTYCTCGMGKDICTGHFYTLANCNPNVFGMPHRRRDAIAKLIDKASTERKVSDQLLKDAGSLLLRPHLKPCGHKWLATHGAVHFLGAALTRSRRSFQDT